MKILIVTKNWLGDILFQLPAIEAIRRSDPDAEIVCMAPARCREMLEACASIDRVLIFDEKAEHRSWVSRIVFVLKLRREKFDQAFLLHRSRTRALWTLLAGCRERIGYGHRRRWLLTRPVSEPQKPMHQVDYYLHLLAEVGIPVQFGASYRFSFSEKARQWAEILLRNNRLISKSFVCFHLGANWEPKRWSAGHFAKLADLIWRRWHLPVVVTGAAGDFTLLHAMIQQTHNARIISLIAQTNLEQLGALFSNAICLITGDSGPMHIASGVGTPVIALFGPTDPAWTGPRGIGEKAILRFVPMGFQVPWYGKKLPQGGWLENILPEEVIKTLEERHWIHEPSLQTDLDVAPWRFEHDADLTVQNPKRILLVTLSNIGDVIMTTPVIAALVSKFPGCQLTVVVGPRAAGVLQGSHLIHKIIIYDKKANLYGKWQFLKAIRQSSYDWVVDLRNTLIPILVNTKKRSPLVRSFKRLSMRERHFEIINKMGVEESKSMAFDFFGNRDEMSVLEKLHARGIDASENWILIAPVAASELKTWALDGFRKVIRRLLEEQGSDILIVGDERERKIAEPLVAINPARIHNVAGCTTLRELAVLVSRCSLLLANDSAVMHMGYELNRPVVAVFGPTHHEKYGRKGPWFRIVRESVVCAPCEKPVCRMNRKICFEDLNPDRVFDACKELLDADSSTL